jgi:GDP-D-mannose dehydratase
MQWMMLQQDQPDFVIATGVQYSVRRVHQMVGGATGHHPAL